MIRKMENAGCSKPVAGMVIPSGLTFNPDGQAIYYTAAATFIAQALSHDHFVERTSMMWAAS